MTPEKMEIFNTILFFGLCFAAKALTLLRLALIFCKSFPITFFVAKMQQFRGDFLARRETRNVMHGILL